jgi:hypothetical protein
MFVAWLSIGSLGISRDTGMSLLIITFCAFSDKGTEAAATSCDLERMAGEEEMFVVEMLAAMSIFLSFKGSFSACCMILAMRTSLFPVLDRLAAFRMSLNSGSFSFQSSFS